MSKERAGTRGTPALHDFADSEHAGQSGYHWITPVLVALIGAFMSILDSSIVNVAIPTMMNVFNVKPRLRSSGYRRSTCSP